ncbi:sialate O-acetylesterase-like [Clytia hemisphaerica]|uniref:Sialate O-acetylesterase domain-containing protein n=1 Tax=Clytia hemisphaerica TaxID=252671 RepID=A0A7M5XD92_9CNID
MLVGNVLRLIVICSLLRQIRCVFRLASTYGNHMVLQRAPQQATIWGYSLQGAKITVSVAGTNTVLGQTVVNTVGQNGVPTWLVKLNAVPAGGPFNLVITQHGVIGVPPQVIYLLDVYFGDVWLCSGQSNMEMNLFMAHRRAQEIPLANHFPRIRLMAVQRQGSAIPVEEMNASKLWYKPSPWAPANAVTVGGQAPYSYFSAICWMYARQLYARMGSQVPIGLIETAFGGSAIEAWTTKEALATCGITTPVDQQAQNQISVLWNSMIHPLLKMSIYGALWYQGESNTPRAAPYACEFTNMINSWRREWHSQSQGTTRKDFPFGFVQLSTVGSNPNHPFLKMMAQNLPELRRQQTLVSQKVANTFMAVSLDLPDDVNNPYGAIHPRFKFEVSRRLVEGALAVAYQLPTYWKGPIVEKITLAKLTTAGPLKWNVNVIFKPLSVASTGILLKHHLGFEIKFTNKRTNQLIWLPAEGAQLTSHNTVSLITTLDSNLFSITGVRYNWSNQPCKLWDCAVYSSLIPARPFIINAPF